MKKHDEKDIVSNVEYEAKEEIKEEANAKEVDIEPSKVIDVESKPVNNSKA
ncbi:hypothetical protein HMPREF1982_01212 [Clostridiales bacterium oral taxon 876 str. F0540]|nr:hypothetical protein HMPREF1982_01212 [Clostridiales bacterium oral taxon 876 str. F0540]